MEGHGSTHGTVPWFARSDSIILGSIIYCACCYSILRSRTIFHEGTIKWLKWNVIISNLPWLTGNSDIHVEHSQLYSILLLASKWRRLDHKIHNCDKKFDGQFYMSTWFPRYIVKYYSTCFCESVFVWYFYLNPWTLNEADCSL